VGSKENCEERERERERRQNGIAIATKVRDRFPRQRYQMQGG
jgi:hypothetical protein